MGIQITSAKPTVHWERNSRDTRTFPSTMRRPRCGTADVLSQQVVQRAAREVDEEAVEGRGDADCPLSNRASESWGHHWGTPTSSAISSGRSLMHTVACAVGDLQATWLFLFCCVAAKPNFLLRTVSPAFSSAHAAQRSGPEGWGPQGWGAQNFALFVPSPATFFFLLSLGSLLVEFWWCFEAPGPSNVHVWSYRVVV